MLFGRILHITQNSPLPFPNCFKNAFFLFCPKTCIMIFLKSFMKNSTISQLYNAISKTLRGSNVSLLKYTFIARFLLLDLMQMHT